MDFYQVYDCLVHCCNSHWWNSVFTSAIKRYCTSISIHIPISLYQSFLLSFKIICRFKTLLLSLCNVSNGTFWFLLSIFWTVLSSQRRFNCCLFFPLSAIISFIFLSFWPISVFVGFLFTVSSCILILYSNVVLQHCFRLCNNPFIDFPEVFSKTRSRKETQDAWWRHTLTSDCGITYSRWRHVFFNDYKQHKHCNPYCHRKGCD